jgi:hypothetical protein
MSTVDPIRYAWESCNRGVPFPSALRRSATASAVATSLSNAHTDLSPEAAGAGVSTAQAALHSFVVGDLRRIANLSPTESSGEGYGDSARSTS